jgi:hypothetical protein
VRSSCHLIAHSDAHRTVQQMTNIAERCSWPLSLTKTTVNTATGEVGASSRFQKACGSRLTEKCPECSKVYARDLLTLVGEVLDPHLNNGGRVTFLTLTAPGSEVFGATHSRLTMKRKDGTPYARPCSCGVIHREDDERLGTPVDPKAYDYDAAANWNANAGRLLAVTLQRLSRTLYPERDPQTGKQRQLQRFRIAEYQRRGLIHFHLFVLDEVTTDQLELVVRGRAASDDTPEVPRTSSRGIWWGSQCDAKQFAEKNKAQLGYYVLKAVGYVAKSTGVTASGAYRHEKSMRRAAAKTCSCDHALTCYDGPETMTVPLEDEDGVVTWVSCRSSINDENQNCVRHRLARRGWGFRGHVFATSRGWGITLGEVRDRRRLFVGAVAIPSLTSFYKARQLDPAISPPRLLVIWDILRSTPRRE